MKRRISTAELMELSPEQQEKLREWWSPKEGDWWKPISSDEPQLLADHLKECCRRECGHDSLEDWGNYLRKHCLPILSVGQCIELLGENLIGIEQYDDWWEVKRWDGENGKSCSSVKTILIDALWEAIKSIL